MSNKTLFLLAMSVSLMMMAGCSRTGVEPVAAAQQPAFSRSTQWTVTYLVPKDIGEYVNTELAYLNGPKGGADPALRAVYVEKATAVVPGQVNMWTAVQAAVASIPTGGGPEHANVVYLKKVESTVYIMLDVDSDGWAGVSFFLGEIRPVMIKNIIQDPSVENVFFGKAPQDMRN